MSVTICKAKNGVDFLTPYKNQKNPEKPRGFFRIEQTAKTINLDGSVWKNTRSHLIKGEIATLQELLVEHKYTSMQGKIIYTEIVESDLDLHPNLKRNLVSDLVDIAVEDFTPEQLQTLEERMQSVIKRTGENGIEMLNNGERILRFTQYDSSDSLSDTIVEHTNVAEVNAFRIAERLQKENTPANLPQ
jgi:hypothetical protein